MNFNEKRLIGVLSKFMVSVLFLINAVTFSVKGAAASSHQPNLQEMRAQQEIQVENMKKQQELAVFKKQRDDLLAQYQGLMRARDGVDKQIKVAQRDYKNAVAQLNKAKSQETDIQAQIGRLQQNASQVDKSQGEQQLQKLQQAQDRIFANMKNFQQIQDQSYGNMQSLDAQFKSLSSKAQLLRQQIDAVQKQFEFVMSQP